ncbi:MAG: hypothetical protein BIFFINMI_01363 [Phycisphaerae bacterium]|nr:hypothetical protein [Phycisphaerae bacterium]
MLKLTLIVAGILAMAGQAYALDVPLTVRESAGVARVDNPVNSGVPLPKGAVKDAGELRLLDADGHVVLASIEPRERWLGDDSLEWVTVHFVVPKLAANASLQYKLVTSDAALPASPLSVTQAGKTIVVVTGPAKFVISTDKFGPLAQVYVRADASKDFADADAMLREAGGVTLVARNGQSKVVPRTDEHKGEFKSELVRIDEAPFTQTAVVSKAEVEERGPGRAVVKLAGTFSTKDHPSLDFVARLCFYANSSLAQMTFSVMNRQMDSFANFVGIDRLAVEVPMANKADGARIDLDSQQRANAAAKLPMTLVQTATDKATLTTGDGQTVEGKRSAGWVQTIAGSFTAGTRWFWQTHPMGLTVAQDGAVTLELKASAGERVDLYTAGAKTHFMFFRFAGAHSMPDGPAAAAGTMHPLFAACSPDWYCEKTRVFGDLYAANLDLFAPQYRDRIAAYQKEVDACIRRIVANRPRPGWKVDEFGWLNFGSGLHHKNYVLENAAESWWDGNYYDFPHAAIVNYLRTGEPINLTTAEEAGLHLADLDICHCYPGSPEQAGSPRSGPVVGHFRNYTSGQTYTGHNSFTFYKNESLYELYYLTGERWYHDVGLLSSEFAMQRWGQGALRNLAHGIWGVLSAYHDTHDKRYLDRATFFVDKWGKPWQDKNGGSFDDQLWMYGLLFEAYDKYYRLTGDVDTAKYNVKAIDAAMAEESADGRWKNSGARSGICLMGYGLAYEYTGDRKYLDYGLAVLDKTARSSGGDRVKTFAQQFRASPYFLKYLTRDYVAPAPVVKEATGSH